MTVTKKGHELAARLRRVIEMSDTQYEDVVLTCSRLCKQQATLHRLNEMRCSDANADANEINRKDEIAERAVEKHLKTLRQQTGIDVGVLFMGDPRGPAVKLTLPAPMRHIYDSAGQEGVCVP